MRPFSGGCRSAVFSVSSFKAAFGLSYIVNFVHGALIFVDAAFIHWVRMSFVGCAEEALKASA